MKISIITVVKNAKDTLENTLLSVFNQSYKNIELIVIDGDSTDGTLDIIEKYRDKMSYFISEPDSGIYNAMNKGIKTATGDVLYFLNANDSLYDNRVLEDIAKEFEVSKAKIIFGDVFFTSNPLTKDEIYHFTPNQVYKYDFITWKYSFYYKNLCHQVIFYKKELFDQIGLYNEDYKIFADYEFNMRTFVNHNIKCKYIDRVIANFELGGISTINSDEIKRKQQAEQDSIVHNACNSKIFNQYKNWYLFMNKYGRSFLRIYDVNPKVNKITNKILAFLLNGRLNLV